MSSIPSNLENYPYGALNQSPKYWNQPIAIADLLQFDLDADIPCACCGKMMIVEEGIIEGSDTAAYLVCAYCFSIIGVQTGAMTTALQNEVYQAMGVVAAEAINPDDLVQPNSESLSYPWV
jgi:hypothetical protein